MEQNARPPTPERFVSPNFLAVMDAVDVPFPISKRELLEQVEEDTVLLGGRNVSLHELIKDIHDDYFESEAEFLDALETQYSTLNEVETEPASGRTSTETPEGWRGPGEPGDVGPSALDERARRPE